MIISDNETKIDMINNRAVAKTVVELIKESKERPISIGIHGDWGAGKSSVLEMVEDEFGCENDIECIKFNGWKYQGFEDAKIALMSAIVSTLIEKRKLSEVCADKVKKVWKNINWLSVAKTSGSLALSVATGTPPIGLLMGAAETLKSSISDKEKVEGAIDKIGTFLNDSKVFEDTSMTKEFSEFQKSFEELLEASSIKKLVVLIDDLDRCLPEVTIETLEAVRLFMFSNSTAFVVAADEIMIEYAVKQHFPDLIDSEQKNIGKEFSKRYLEKLIQVPFRLPSLGEIESEMYITMLLIGSKLEDNGNEFEKLLELAIEKMKKPWKNNGFTISEINSALGDKYGLVTNEVSISTQIGGILANHTYGNPRKIKRFINMLLLRRKVADARGFGDEVELPILAKLMLAEYFLSDFYKEISSQTDDYGICTCIKELEKELLNLDNSNSKKSDITKENQRKLDTKAVKEITTETNSQIKEWVSRDDIRKWILTEPELSGIDLRPYFFASKEKNDYFFNQVKSDRLRLLIDRLMSTTMNIANSKGEIEKLTEEEALRVFDILSSKILAQSNIQDKPRGIDGIISLVTLHPELECNLIKLIETFEIKKVGAWICSGWDICLRSPESKENLNLYYRKLKQEGNSLVKSILTVAIAEV
ncbi:Qat anti-phage system ATPase QatA [Clostridium perfringens]